MKAFIPIWIAEAVFAGLFIVTGYPKATKKGFTFKMLACAVYMASGLYAYSLSAKTAYGVTILAGLVCGWIGDVFLGLDPFTEPRQNKKLSMTVFLIGGFFFLLGHIAYIVAFLRLMLERHAFRVLPFLLALGGVLLCFALVFGLAKVKAGKLLIPLTIYAVALASMCALAICTALLAYKGQSVVQCVLIPAPLLFAFSDVTLALRIADEERFESLPMRTVSLGAYFLAQMLLGLTIRLV